MSTDREIKLIKRIQNKADRCAADELVQTYYREIYAFAYRQMGNIDSAMDITQEIFISALQSLSRFDVKLASFRTWLYHIASNKIVDYFRSSQYKRQLSSVALDSIDFPVSESLEETYIDCQIKQEAVRAMAELPFDSQKILRLKLYAEYSFAEISQALSIPESTAKTKYYAALKELRRKVM